MHIPARDGDLDGFREVEAPKQATVILFVLPSAWGLTLEKTPKILAIISREEDLLTIFVF